MQGLRGFIHHPNPDNVSHPDTHAILHALDAVVEAEEPSIITLLGKAGTGKSALLNYWATDWQCKERRINIERAPILVAEVDETERRTLGKGVYTTATACVTFSSIVFALGELALRQDGPNSVIRWYRDERSLYTDTQFVWLVDQVYREIRRLRVRAVVIDNAHRLDVPTMKALMKLRARRNNRLALLFGAQLAKNEQLDEPMGKLFEQAKIDPADTEVGIELKPLTETVFYDPVLVDLFADLETDFEDGLEEHAEFIGTALWEITTGDWKSINSRVKHFNRLLGPRAGRRRLLTRTIVEQVLGKKLPN